MVVEVLVWCGGPLALMVVAYAALFAWMDRTR